MISFLWYNKNISKAGRGIRSPFRPFLFGWPWLALALAGGWVAWGGLGPRNVSKMEVSNVCKDLAELPEIYKPTWLALALAGGWVAWGGLAFSGGGPLAAGGPGQTSHRRPWRVKLLRLST